MSFLNYSFTIAKNCFNNYNLLYLTKSKYENDWGSGLHIHDITEIMYITGGSGRLLLNDGEKSLSAGDLVIINPNIIHTEDSSADDPLEYYVLGIENIVFSDFSKQQPEDSDPIFIFNFSSTAHRKMLNFLFDKIENELIDKRPYFEAYCHSLMNELLVFIIRETDMRDTEETAQTHTKECAFVKKYMDYHFAETITLEDLAKKTFISKFYLSHSFKKQYGMPPITYLLDKRLEVAKTLLHTTDHPITKISTIIGFSSPSHFAKAFKQKTGKTPQAYRDIADMS